MKTKTIEERAKEFAMNKSDMYCGNCDTCSTKCEDYREYVDIATEQKAIDEEVQLKKSDDMTQAEYDREVAFANWYHQNGKGTPTYSDAIEWARKDLLDKACEWLKENARDYACATVRCPYGEEEEIICDVHLEIVEDFRKAMEE